jgi:hypothetical protein
VRRFFVSTSLAAASIVALADGSAPITFSFTNIAQQAGLTATTVYGGKDTNKYLLETTGCGVAALDVDNDGYLDIFLVNGSVLEGFPKGSEPTNHLYRNRRDGTFEDITDKAGLKASGWGQGACAADYDNDGFDDLFVTYWGQNRLYRNNGNATFTEVTAKAGLTEKRQRWGAGCAFVDYDRDGRLDLFLGGYYSERLNLWSLIDTKIMPESFEYANNGGRKYLYRNLGQGRFEDVSANAGLTSTR